MDLHLPFHTAAGPGMKYVALAELGECKPRLASGMGVREGGDEAGRKVSVAGEGRRQEGRRHLYAGSKPEQFAAVLGCSDLHHCLRWYRSKKTHCGCLYITWGKVVGTERWWKELSRTGKWWGRKENK